MKTGEYYPIKDSKMVIKEAEEKKISEQIPKSEQSGTQVLSTHSLGLELRSLRLNERNDEHHSIDDPEMKIKTNEIVKNSEQIPKLEQSGTQDFGSNALEAQNVENSDIENFSKEINQGLDQFNEVINQFVQNMETDWKRWRNEVSEINTKEGFLKLSIQFTEHSEEVLSTYSELGKKFDKKELELLNINTSLNEEDIKKRVLITDVLRDLQNLKGRLNNLTKQWKNLTKSFEKNVIQRTKANFDNFHRVAQHDQSFWEPKLEEENVDLRMYNKGILGKLKSEINRAYVESIYNFLKSFLITKNPGVSEGNLYANVDLEYALASDLASGYDVKVSEWRSSEILDWYHSLPEQYSLNELMSALSTFTKIIQGGYEAELEQEARHLKIIKDLLDTPPPLKTLTKQAKNLTSSM